MRLHFFILLAFTVSICISCGLFDSGGTEGSGQGTVFLWIGSDKDSYVSCGQDGPPCPEEELNFGDNGSLVVARNGVALKKSYIHFGLPLLPDGSIVEEAFFEIFHPGKNEDGQTDNIQIPLARAAGSWSPLTVTLENEPNPQLTGAEYSIKLRSQSWSGSPNIVDLVRNWYNNPDSNHGFYIYWNQETPGIEKGFYSNNDIRRTADDLGLSPRLLLKVRLPDGKTSNDIDLPPIPGDNDLDFGGREILMMRFRGGDDWPDDWNVQQGG